MMLRASRPGYPGPKSDPDPWARPGSKTGPKIVKYDHFWPFFTSKYTKFLGVFCSIFQFSISFSEKKITSIKTDIVSTKQTEWRRNLKSWQKYMSNFSTFFGPGLGPGPVTFGPENFQTGARKKWLDWTL